MGEVTGKVIPYKFESIRILVCFDELVDVPIYHPFRRHCKFSITHCCSQQRQHVWMAKRFPRHNLLAEPLKV